MQAAPGCICMYWDCVASALVMVCASGYLSWVAGLPAGPLRTPGRARGINYQVSTCRGYPPPPGVAEKRVMIIYNIYKYTTHSFGHLKDLGPVAYRLSPTQRQNRASLLPIHAPEGPEIEEMTAYRGQHGGGHDMRPSLSDGRGSRKRGGPHRKPPPKKIIKHQKNRNCQTRNATLKSKTQP